MQNPLSLENKLYTLLHSIALTVKSHVAILYCDSHL